MKKTLMMAILLTFLLSSCGSVKMISTKKLPDNAENAVMRARKAQNIKGAFITMNPVIPLEEHAYVIMPQNISLRSDVIGEIDLGGIAVFPPGNFEIPFVSRYGSRNIMFSVEAGNYYWLDFTGDFAVALDLTDREKLEHAKQDLAAFKVYLEYMKNHPNALDGTYRDHRGSTLIINGNKIVLSGVIRGMEILYDGETIVLLDDGKYNSSSSNSYLTNIWYYRFNNDGNMELILNANQILAGFSTVVVFKPVPEESLTEITEQ